jgi:acylphosphatase
MKTIRCIFKGKVQGVYFRAYTEDFANELNVKGWVKNLPDGSVEAIFQGKEENIKEVIRKLKEEHPYAKVKEVLISYEDTGEIYKDFSIKY